MAVKPVPEGYHTITPYLTVGDLRAELEFVKRAFDARVTEAIEVGGNIVHSEVVIGDSKVMIGQARPGQTPSPAMLYMYVPDAEQLYKKALAAGGTSVSEMATQFYGDRSGAVSDPAGNQWWIATHVEDVPPEELSRRAAQARS